MLDAEHAGMPQALRFDEVEQQLTRSPTIAWYVIVGLPSLGVLAALAAELPLFAVLMAGCFLLATTFVLARAMARFAGRTLRLLVAARMVVALVLGALLLTTGAAAWMAVVSGALLWLVADRLLGRAALTDLGRRRRRAG
jgi:hypothetical protein